MRDLVKKSDDALRGHEGRVYYFSALAIDYITVVLPILLIFTVSTLFAALICLHDEIVKQHRTGNVQSTSLYRTIQLSFTNLWMNF
jgi:hypothetical protein